MNTTRSLGRLAVAQPTLAGCVRFAILATGSGFHHFPTRVPRRIPPAPAKIRCHRLETELDEDEMARFLFEVAPSFSDRP